LVRRFGEDWYMELEVAEELKKITPEITPFFIARPNFKFLYFTVL
jgi:hypothetical protein